MEAGTSGVEAAAGASGLEATKGRGNKRTKGPEAEARATDARQMLRERKREKERERKRVREREREREAVIRQCPQLENWNHTPRKCETMANTMLCVAT